MNISRRFLLSALAIITLVVGAITIYIAYQTSVQDQSPTDSSAGGGGGSCIGIEGGVVPEIGGTPCCENLGFFPYTDTTSGKDFKCTSSPCNNYREEGRIITGLKCGIPPASGPAEVCGIPVSTINSWANIGQSCTRGSDCPSPGGSGQVAVCWEGQCKAAPQDQCFWYSGPGNNILECNCGCPSREEVCAGQTGPQTAVCSRCQNIATYDCGTPAPTPQPTPQPTPTPTPQPQPNPTPSVTTYTCDLNTYQCAAVNGNSGEYSTLAACNDNCIVPTETTTYACNDNNECVVAEGESGEYADLGSCITDCTDTTTPEPAVCGEFCDPSITNSCSSGLACNPDTNLCELETCINDDTCTCTLPATAFGFNDDSNSYLLAALSMLMAAAAFFLLKDIPYLQRVAFEVDKRTGLKIIISKRAQREFFETEVDRKHE